MKSKKFSKKLALGKGTVANLDRKDMKAVKGGDYTGDTVCTDFCDTYAECFTNPYDYLCNSYMPCTETQDISACPRWTIHCPI